MKLLSTFFVTILLTIFITANCFSQSNTISIQSSDKIITTLPDVMGNYKSVDLESGKSEVLTTLDYPVFNGFPVTQDGTNIEGGIFCNLDNDPELEIMFNLDFTVNAWNMDGTTVPGWPKTLSQVFQSAPAFGDIDGDGVEEIVVTSYFGTSNGTLYAYEKDGTMLSGFPVSYGYPTRSPVLSDLDNDGAMEIIVSKRTYPTGEVHVYKGDGTLFSGWPKTISSVPAASAAVGDITGDGVPEIVFEAYQSIYVWDINGNPLSGFPFDLPSGTVTSYSSPVLADLDGDDIREIIFGAHESEGNLNGKVYVLKNDGTVYSGWPQTTTMWVYSAPAVGYIDGDNILDIAVGDQVLSGSPADKVYAWDAHGNLLTGFPYGPVWAVNSQILLADIDNDNMTELIYDDNTIDGDGFGYYHALNHDGTPVDEFPVQTVGTTFFNNPALTDIDYDGTMDMIGAGTTGFGSDASTNVYLWNTQMPYPFNQLYVPVFQYNLQHTGVFDDPVLVPVELTSFTATVSDRKVNLHWQTATELNNHGFEIQRTSPGTKLSQNNNWVTIGFLEGNGTTTEEKDYTFVDENPGEGTIKYRLKQVDFDGNFEYSEIVEVTIDQPLDFALKQNYPNPFNPATTIEFQIAEKGFVSLKVFDVLGNEVASLVNEFKETGSYKVIFDAQNLPSGIYFYKLNVNGKFNNVKKMLLMK